MPPSIRSPRHLRHPIVLPLALGLTTLAVWYAHPQHFMLAALILLATLTAVYFARKHEQLERNALDSLGELNAILEAATHGVTLIKDRVIIHCNHRLNEIFGYAPGELVGQSTRVWYLDEDAYLAGGRIYPSLAGGQTHRREEHVKRKDGSTFWCRLSGRHIDPDRPEQGTVWLIEDVTAERVARQQLNTARAQAENANRAKSEFLANMSHEIRTPMSAMLGLTQLVLDTPLQPRQKDFLKKALESGHALLEILNDILDYSKIEAGHLAIEQTPFSVEAIVRGIGDLFAARLLEKDLPLTFELSPALPATVVGDPLRLHQILANLVGNAIKFTPRGEICIGVTATPSSPEQLRLEFTVRDTGIGLDPEHAERLFQPFTQADGSISRQYGGTGLGLAICHRLVTLMGGKIAAAGTPGQGATFTFCIMVGHIADVKHPGAFAAKSALAGRLPVPDASSAATLRFEGARILIAEDNLLNQKVAVGFLKKLGITVVIADNGSEAVARAGAMRFDAVLMDLHMPVMDGLEATRQIHALPQAKTVPVIALTAAVMDEDRERCRAAGMVDFLPKPLDREQLATVLAHYLKPVSATATGMAAPVPEHPDIATLHTLFDRLRPYLEAREFVPDPLTQSLADIAGTMAPGTAFPRLLRAIDEFDHDGALALIGQIIAQSSPPASSRHSNETA
jgi:PAS domain S-box-containing protein